MEYKELEEKLDIFIITYNRAKKLDKTLSEILCSNSPIKNFPITIFDNNSTDETFLVVQEYQKKYPNLNYQKNNYNIGGNGNIAKAFYSAKKEYVWVLADNDNYCFDSFFEVARAIEEKTDAIVVSTFDCPKFDIAQLFIQMTFVPGVIYKTSNLDDTAMGNMMFNISNLFPHLALASKMINHNKKIKILDKPIVLIGSNDDENGKYIYTRGYSEDVHPLQNSINWFCGYANSLWMIKDKKTRKYLMNHNKFSIPLTSPKLFFHKPREVKANPYNYFCIFSALDCTSKIKFLLNLFFYYTLYRIVFIYKNEFYNEEKNLIVIEFNLRLLYFMKTKLFKTKRVCQ